jgi:iron complex transport system permease protein
LVKSDGLKRLKTVPVLVVSAAILLAVIIIGVGLGAVQIPATDIIKSIINYLRGFRGADQAGPWQTIIMQIRLPRVILAAMAGSALATGGVCFQAVLRNPLADPFVIGVSAGAGLGAALGLALSEWLGSTGIALLPVFSFLGALLATALVYGLSLKNRRVDVGRLLLAGVAVSSFLTALMSMLIVWRQQDMQKLVFWMMGSFSGRGWEHVQVTLPYLAAGLISAGLLAGRLNLLALGEERAFYLGLRVEVFKAWALLTGSLLAATAVSVSGVIGFVGLMIPHIVRLLVGPDHRILLPASALVGAAFLIAADIAARIIMPPIEIPIGILTALSGTPFFLWLLRKRGQY